MDIVWIVLSWVFVGLFFAARTESPCGDENDGSVIGQALQGNSFEIFLLFLITIFSPAVALYRIVKGLTNKYVVK